MLRLLIPSILAQALAAPMTNAGLDPGTLTASLGAEAKLMPDGAIKASWPRTDVKVTVEGIPVAPQQGLASWVAFTPAHGEAMLMGDTMLFEDEVDAAMDAALANGLRVTALHNHFSHDEPRVFFMHISGDGDAASLAKGARAVWDAVKAVRSRAAVPIEQTGAPVPVAGPLDADAISKVLGHTAKLDGGVAKAVVARHATMQGVDIGESMGLTTWAAFAGSDALAVTDGDFIMSAAEVQPVLSALRAGGLHIVALHNHMIGEQPAFFFTHFWGEGKASDLAKAVRAALDAQRTATP
jgi:hypothetical protein